ncbi:ETC complex I subunit conserved region-domain-containing protein [Paraphysoderma sedebokerense]|nr:ETC complex I subunit conserved region-domain-containing protein [Paraphysoderma sedebokerense]
MISTIRHLRPIHPLSQRALFSTLSRLNYPSTANPASSPASSSSLVKHDQTSAVSVDFISGAPDSIRLRTVRIFKPAKTAMQSGLDGTRFWRIDFDIQDRWENPLMGWCSSGDPVQALNMKFASKDEAIMFAERQGWQYQVDEPHPRKFRKKMYADNYKYSPGKLRICKTK